MSNSKRHKDKQRTRAKKIHKMKNKGMPTPAEQAMNARKNEIRAMRAVSRYDFR